MTRAHFLPALALLLAAGPAAAQEVERKTFMDFSDDVIEGELLRQDGEYLKLGTARMRRANRVAAALLKARMRKRRPNDLKLIRRAGAADVVVVRGGFDRAQDVLRSVGVKHVVIPPRLVARVPFMSLQTVMLNCPGKLSGQGRKRLRRFVKTGGYLVTTDWALSTVARMFPGTIARGARNTTNDVVRVQLQHQADPLLGKLASAGNPRWWLEAASFPIRVLNSRRVKVLIASKEMKRKYGHGAIAVTFRHDDGRVLHLTSHFYLQQAKLRSAKERASGRAYAESMGIKGKALQALLRRGLDRVKAGAIDSAYSMQQVTTNVLVSKARQNRALLKRFSSRARVTFKLRPAPSSNAKPLADSTVKQGYLLQVLQRKGAWVLVRDLFARQGWALRSYLT